MILYLGLGSNMGDREGYLKSALAMIDAVDGFSMDKISSVYETAPVGGPEQPDYLNMVMGIRTDESPFIVLDIVQKIEQSLHRVRNIRWGPRTIDIDLLLAADIIIREDRLTLPHPRYRERAFVLVPFTEIAPDVVDPETGRTIKEISSDIDMTGIRKIGPMTR